MVEVMVDPSVVMVVRIGEVVTATPVAVAVTVPLTLVIKVVSVVVVTPPAAPVAASNEQVSRDQILIATRDYLQVAAEAADERMLEMAEEAAEEAADEAAPPAPEYC